MRERDLVKQAKQFAELERSAGFPRRDENLRGRNEMLAVFEGALMTLHDQSRTHRSFKGLLRYARKVVAARKT